MRRPSACGCLDARPTPCRPIYRPSTGSTSCTPRSPGGPLRLCSPMPGAGWATGSWTRTSHRSSRIDTNITGTLYLVQKSDATCARREPARSSSPVRLQDIRRACITRSITPVSPSSIPSAPPCGRAAGCRHHCDVADAWRYQDRFLRARRPRAHQAGTRQDGRCRRRRPAGLRCDAEGVGPVVTGWHNEFLAAMRTLSPPRSGPQMFGKHAEPHSAHE